jgi:outer membrane putative beta-barrel porin/alpha-amylase
MRIASLVLALLLAGAVPVIAEDEEPTLDFVYPLTTRRPVIERELEFRFVHEKSTGGRETDTTAGLEWALTSRWQIELEVPLVVLDPRDGAVQAGVGDVEIENKFLLYSSLERKVALAAGAEVRLPTGSERRGLGGEFAVEPFVAAAIARGDFDILASAAYEVNANAHLHAPREHELTTGVAAGYRFSRWFTPLVELTTITRTNGDNDDGLRDRIQVYVTPGFNVRPLPRTTVRFGVQLPVTHAREFDYALHAGLVWEF